MLKRGKNLEQMLIVVQHLAEGHPIAPDLMPICSDNGDEHVKREWMPNEAHEHNPPTAQGCEVLPRQSLASGGGRSVFPRLRGE